MRGEKEDKGKSSRRHKNQEVAKDKMEEINAPTNPTRGSDQASNLTQS